MIRVSPSRPAMRIVYGHSMAEAKIASQRHSGRTKARHQGCKDIFKRCIRSRNKVLPELARKELDPFVWTDFLRRQLESCGGA
jgi:hypothetical protein